MDNLVKIKNLQQAFMNGFSPANLFMKNYSGKV